MSPPKALTGDRRAGFVRLCLIALALAVLSGTSAYLVRDAIDGIIGGMDPLSGQSIASLFGLTLTALGAAWLRQRERVEAERLGQHYVHAVRMRLYDRLGTLPPRDLQRHSRGGSLLRFVGDLTAIRQWVSLGLARLGVASITAVGSLAAIATISFSLAATVALVLTLAGGGALALGKSLNLATRRARQYRARLTGDINERIALMPVVQAFSQVERERSRIRRRSRDLYNSMILRAQTIGHLRGLTEASTGLSLVAIVAVGSAEVARGTTSVGAIFAALTVLAFLSPALRDLGRVYELWHGYRVSMERIRAYLAIRPSVKSAPTAEHLPNGPGAIELNGVSLGNVLRSVNGVVPPGATVALVGPNGSGKSTILSLIARHVEPTGGSIEIDGKHIHQVMASSVRSAIGMVSPDLPLMRGTVGRNIRYRLPRASDADVERICRICGIDKVLESLPRGLDSRIVEGGINLSPGQRQRIALARALIGGPRILLLDEVDANLDTDSGRLVERILTEFDGTVLFVSHRAEQVARADIIWHVADGEIIERGSPDALLRNEGPTFRLFRRSHILAA